MMYLTRGVPWMCFPWWNVNRRMLFESGNELYWGIATAQEVLTLRTNAPFQWIDTWESASFGLNPRTYHRQFSPEDPWLSSRNHIGGCTHSGDDAILYGANAIRGCHTKILSRSNGMNVWIEAPELCADSDNDGTL